MQAHVAAECFIPVFPILLDKGNEGSGNEIAHCLFTVGVCKTQNPPGMPGTDPEPARTKKKINKKLKKIKLKKWINEPLSIPGRFIYSFF